jgi:carbonic anhydrase
VVNLEMVCGCCGKGRHEFGAPSRRGLMRAGLATVGALGMAAVLPRRALAQTVLTPDEALTALIDGNKRFIQTQLNSFSEDLTILKQNTVDKQEPFAAVLSCADSRVPVELVFDQSIGHLFVARVAGNIATSEIIASLEYGAAVLGTRAILVLGHSGCGAVKAAMAGKQVPGQISDLFAPLRPAVDEGDGNLEATIKDNAKIQAHLLATASPLLNGLIKDQKLKVAAGYYALDTGAVTLLD